MKTILLVIAAVCLFCLLWRALGRSVGGIEDIGFSEEKGLHYTGRPLSDREKREQ